MDEKKLTPLQMVAQEMEEHGSLDRSQCELAYRGILDALHDRAMEALTEDDTSDESETRAQEFLAFAELLSGFGSQLIAFEDIEADDISEITVDDLEDETN